MYGTTNMDNNKMNENEFEFKGFYDILVKSISPDNKHYELLKHCPQMFSLLCHILSDYRTDWHTKAIINASLAYFVIPEDIIPDNQEKGYLDDLFIVAYALNHIKESGNTELILENWNGSEDILNLIDFIHSETKIIIGGENYLKILRLVGLRKLESFDLTYQNTSHSKRMSRISDEKKEILGVLSFLASKIYGMPRSRSSEQIIEFLKQHEDYHEIERFIKIAKQEKKNSNIGITSRQSNSTINDSLREKRIKELLRR